MPRKTLRQVATAHFVLAAIFLTVLVALFRYACAQGMLQPQQNFALFHVGAYGIILVMAFAIAYFLLLPTRYSLMPFRPDRMLGTT